MKLIVKSKSWCFNGLFFRNNLPNSIEWTSFDMAAMTFESRDSAIIHMAKCGIKNFDLIDAPTGVGEPSPSTGYVRPGHEVRQSFIPSPASGFNPQKS